MKPGTLVTVTWPDGSRSVGRTATELLDRLGAQQWEPCSRAAMKRRLSDRAWSWDGTLIDPELDDAAFLAVLTTSTMATVTWHTEQGESE